MSTPYLKLNKKIKKKEEVCGIYPMSMGPNVRRHNWAWALLATYCDLMGLQVGWSALLLKCAPAPALLG